MYVKLATFLFLLYCSSCAKQVPSIPPVYVHINSIPLQTDMSTQGSASSNITDAWVYLDGAYFGTFALPATFPVLLSGNHRIKISPGIKIDGAGGNRIPYPMYTSYIKDIAFSQPVYLDGGVNYTPNVNIVWIEDFEKSSKSSGMIVEREPSLVFEGKGSGAVYLDNINTFAEFKSNTNFVLPKSGAPIYLELNYKANLQFSVNITSRTSSVTTTVPVGGGNPSWIWKKIYFDLTPAVASNIDALDYGISITVQNKNSNKGGNLFLDNVKLVCLK